MSHHGIDHRSVHDVELGAGGLNIGGEDSFNDAAGGSLVDDALKSGRSAPDVHGGKRQRSASRPTLELFYECFSSAECDTLPSEQNTHTPSLPVLKGEASESECECHGSGQKKGWIKTHNDDDRGQIRCRSVATSAKAAGQNRPETVKEDAELVSASASVTVCVPTMFTTAAGRPICVREVRSISPVSPYWNLLRFVPERGAALDVAEASLMVSKALDGAERLGSLTREATNRRERLLKASWETTETRVRPLISTHLGEEWLAPRSLRPASCPERYYSPSRATAGVQSSYALPPFTGFCAANGAPFFASPSVSR
jgi:hypothetical protein